MEQTKLYTILFRLAHLVHIKLNFSKILSTKEQSNSDGKSRERCSAQPNKKKLKFLSANVTFISCCLWLLRCWFRIVAKCCQWCWHYTQILWCWNEYTNSLVYLMCHHGLFVCLYSFVHAFRIAFVHWLLSENDVHVVFARSLLYSRCLSLEVFARNVRRHKHWNWIDNQAFNLYDTRTCTTGEI